MPMQGLKSGEKGEDYVVKLRELYTANWTMTNLPMEAQNAFEHFHYLYNKEKPPEFIKDRLEKPVPAIILGSGWSHDNCIDIIKDWKGGIFCSTSHLRNLVANGCYPKYTTAVDPRTDLPSWVFPRKHLEHMWKTKCTTYVTPPTGPIYYTKLWKGRLRYFLTADPTKEWYGNILQPNFPWIKDIMIPFSCNSSALLAMAHYLNYAPIYVAGCDFSGDCRVQHIWENRKWKVIPGHQPYKPEQQIMTYHGLISCPNLLWSWRGFLCVLRIDMERRHGVRWNVYNCGKGNALQNDLPYADIRKVIKNQGRGQHMPWSHKEQMFRLDVALARFHTYIITVHQGIGWGGRPETVTTFEGLKTRIKQINSGLEASKEIASKVPPEQLKKIPGGFDPKLIQGVNEKEYFPYIKKVRKAAGLKDE